MLAIYKRELKSYFTSMIGCIFIAFLTAFTGLYFMVYNLNSGYPYFSVVLESVMFVFIIAIPILTMRSFADERKNKTDQLLFTSPLSLTKVVLGKYFAMVSVLAIPNLIFCFFPLIIKLQGTAHLGVDYATLLAFFLIGCVFISIGMFISSLTESQIIAAIASVGVLFLLYMWEGILQYIPIDAISNILGVFALSTILSNFAENYVFDVAGLVLLLSFIVVFVFLTIQTLQKRRWS